jgi:hypothetical protein
MVDRESRPRAVLQVVLRFARYLGPLLRDALVCLWRMLLDLVAAMQLGWRWLVSRRTPAGVGAFEAWAPPTGAPWIWRTPLVPRSRRRRFSVGWIACY